MEGYRRPPGAAPGDSQSAARETLDEAGAFLRRLIPFPGTETSVASFPAATALRRIGRPSRTRSTAAADIVGEQAASIVSQAASILDEEMARGVLAARRSADTAPYGHSDASNPGTASGARARRQHRGYVAELSQMLRPNGPPALSRGQSDADPLAELRPRTTVKPGQRATISMTLCNSESQCGAPGAQRRRISLGSRGGRIAMLASRIHACGTQAGTAGAEGFDDSERRFLADAAPGCYSGLLVVKGVDYLRALITIEIE